MKTLKIFCIIILSVIFLNACDQTDGNYPEEEAPQDNGSDNTSSTKSGYKIDRYKFYSNW
jgi:PBP1b-binding outer membrane lipoprotein LpoB